MPLRKPDLCPSSGGVGKVPTLLGPLGSLYITHWSSFRNIWGFQFPEYRTVNKSKNPVILCVTDHLPSPLESTVHAGELHIN
jgi:hypothetical protein